MSTSVGARGATFGRKQALQVRDEGRVLGGCPRDRGRSPGAGVAACGEGSLAGPAHVQDRRHSHCVTGVSVACAAVRGADRAADAGPGCPSAWCCRTATGWLN